jgi:hypothetical protein
MGERDADVVSVKRSPTAALVVLVGLSFAVRMAVGWLRAVPALFPDEYTYAALGRSIAETGHPAIRGASAHFPALLEPIVTAPAWLVHDVGLAYRLVQTIGALTMSLAAVPVFLLARRLGLGPRVSLAVAALAVLVPDLVYSSFVSSEALAYPLVLAAVYTGTVALAAPARRAQLSFVAVAALATLARVQFAALPVIFLCAAVVVGARERRLRAAVREQLLPLACCMLPVGALAAAGPTRLLGTYRAVLGFHGGALGIAHWAALDAMTLAYAAGWIVVPGAILGLWLAIERPRSRDELAFGVLAILLAAAVLLEAGFLQASLPLGKEIQERYVFYAVPLIALGFALYAGRGWPLRLPHLALAALLVLVSVRLPLSGYAVASTVDGSSILYGVYWLSGELGQTGAASAVVAGAVGILSVVAVLASRRPRLGTPVALGLAMLACGVASAGAVAFDVVNTDLAKKAYLPGDPSWVDRAEVGKVALVQGWGGSRAASLQELFWNRSIDRVLLLPGSRSIDRYADHRIAVRDDGTLVAAGSPVTGPVLMDSFGSVARLQGANLLQAGPTASLWVPRAGERPRLRLYEIGRYHDRWLADRGAVYLWPSRLGGQLSGWLSMRLLAPRKVGAITITFRLPGGAQTTVRLRPDRAEPVNIRVCGQGPWYATFRSSKHGLLGLRAVSVRSSAAAFRPGTSACRSPEPVS